MKLLFITRTYPPLVGGMEKFAKGFYENYQAKGEIDLIANSGGKKMLLFFFVKVMFFLMINSRKYEIIHIYDAVLSPLVLIIKFVSKAKVSFTVNGLDIVYSQFGYQKFMPFFLSKADKVFAISHYTMEQCVLRGLPKEKLMVIPVGSDFDVVEIFSDEKRTAIMSKLNIPVTKAKILITVGRLVKRKGHVWFIKHVLKNLPDKYIYLIVGEGPEHNSIIGVSRVLNLTKQVYVLGRVSDEEKNCLYQIADLFVMPNIHVENDQEGFGIVLLEAGQYDLPVVASNIEGIRDVVINGRTGYLVKERDVQEFINAILGLDIDRSLISVSLFSRFSWSTIIQRYHEEFSKLSWDKLS